MSAVPALELLSADPDAQAIHDYLAGRTPNTAQAYGHDIECFRNYCPRPFDRLTLADLQGWIQQMQRAGVSRSTIRRRWSTVQGLLRAMAASGAIPSLPPLNEVRLPRIPDTVARRILNRAQVQQMIAAAEYPPAAMAIRMLYYTGIRVSELCGLRWADLSEDEGKGWATITGKGEKTRIVGIPSRLWRDLLEWRGLTGCSTVIDATRFQVYDWVRQAARRAGLRGGDGKLLAISPHWLRHCHITHAREAGCDWDELATQAGHSDPKITRTVYAHLRRGKTSADYLEGSDDTE